MTKQHLFGTHITENNIKGALYGALVGDALGVPVEFTMRETLKKFPVTKMLSYGAWQQPLGTWSDDGALTLATAHTLMRYGMSYNKLADSFVDWWQDGFMCAGETYFDIGGVTRESLSRWTQMRAAPSSLRLTAVLAGGDDERDNGNGSLMRIMPASLWVARLPVDDIARKISKVSAITHRHEQSKLACVFYSLVAKQIVEHGQLSKIDLFLGACEDFKTQYNVGKAWLKKHPRFARVLHEHFYELPEDDINSMGYVLDSLDASLWVWMNNSNYKDTVLHAVNLGGDTDTTGCIAGALAGLYYGFEEIPADWVKSLRRPGVVQPLVKEFTEAVAHQYDTDN